MSNIIKKHPFVTILIFFLFLFILFSFYIFRSFSTEGGVSLTLGEKITVIEIEGVIVESKEIIDEIRRAGKNNSVKGVIIRINSPGGGVAPSQEIYSEVMKLKKKKKVIASLSSIAASGGYYIASAAEKIVANPGTLTGSIGVIMDFSNVEGLLDKIGLKNYVVKSGKFKDIGSPVREMTNEEKELLHNVIENVHSQFVTAIVDGRGMERSKVVKVADGRIFSGEQALTLGLVDKLGTLQDSIDLLAGMSGIEGEPKVVYSEKKKGLIEYILGSRSTGRIYEQLMLPQLMYLAPF